MATITGTLKAGYQLYMDIANGDTDTVFSYTVTGATVKNGSSGWKSDRVAGPYQEDVNYSVTYNGSLNVYKVDQLGRQEYTAAALPDPASLPAGAEVVVDGDVVLKDSSSLNNVTRLFSESKTNLFNRVGARPIGFNYYSLMNEQINGASNIATIRPANLSYIKSTGANLVRVAFAPFSAAEYLTRVHNTATMPLSVSDDNLLESFKLACDTAMDSLRSYGLKAVACVLWGQDHIPSAFGETNVVAYGNLQSKTSVYARSFVRWFCKRYFSHPSFSMLSLGNEYVTDDSGVTQPTPSQLSAWFSSVSSEAKSIDSLTVVTADIASPPVSLVRTKDTVEVIVARMREVFSGLDCYNIHMYGDNYAFTGHQSAEIGDVSNIYYSTLGYEGVESLMRCYRDMADADGKPLIVGEFGVSEVNEKSDQTDATWFNSRKKQRMFKAIVNYSDCALVWNVQDTVQASFAGDQSNWCIDVNGATKRADQFKSLAVGFNSCKLNSRNTGGGLSGRRRSKAPVVSAQCKDRTAGSNLKFVSTSAHASSSGYSVATWVRLDSTLNNAETIFDFRGSGNLSGFLVLALLQASAKSFYSDSRYASGSAGNTNNILPDFNVGEWNHVVINMSGMVINGVQKYFNEVYVNGIYWQSISATAFPASIPVGTTCYALGNSANGVPMRIQDFCVTAGRMTNEDLWTHMNGVVSHKSLLHIRAFDDGVIMDISKNAVSLVNTNIITSIES